MVNLRDSKALFLHMFGIALGFIGIALADSSSVHTIYVIAISAILILTIVVDGSGWIRPYSFLVLSFFVFVWMRYVINIFDGTEIISVGNGITEHNTNVVSVWLGMAMNIICMTAIISSRSFAHNIGRFFEDNSKLRIPRYAENVVLAVALCFFVIFLLDSFRKISVVQMHDYLNMSETILTQGYRWFTVGKWSLLIWIILGRDENKFFKGSTIMAVAGLGYLMRGARGYAIMYMFLWLLFFSQKKKIKIFSLAIIGVALLLLANFILSYRMGWSVASGPINIIKSVLYQQGASVEPVFGTVIFKDVIRSRFSPIELFLRNDFGIFVDRLRGVTWASGGFGSSFFAESYFLGFPINIVFLIIAGICVGFVECAYQISIKMDCAEFANIILFMTIPNLVYLGRSSIKDFIIKTILVAVILKIMRGRTPKTYAGGFSNAKS